MVDLWRRTLRNLGDQFSAKSQTSHGLHHLMIEAPDDQRDQLRGPGWFQAVQWRGVGGHLTDGAKPERWTAFAFEMGLGQDSYFREFSADDQRAIEEDPDYENRVIRDKRGTPRAVFVPSTLRRSHYIGDQSHADIFKALGTSASQVLRGLPEDVQTSLPDDIQSLFRPISPLAKYQFGTLKNTPAPVDAGWNATVFAEDDGVLIYSPQRFDKLDQTQWLLLLHRLGWRSVRGSGLRAERWAWAGFHEVDYRDILSEEARVYLPPELQSIKPGVYYSVIGSKEAPLDVFLASSFAIDLLLTLIPDGPTQSHQSPIGEF